ncbi:hypothetical protein OGATHE_001398 [Ogataea polymorpha]|uniref:Uncharacterized protein n=1 Tax=Ogataea polymorpha TaxID=460523 RepID=A0A9P8TES1_9ASCO|nr:hypothetical protein OGATHE_001398 [Ogataea polymorpha]
MHLAQNTFDLVPGALFVVQKRCSCLDGVVIDDNRDEQIEDDDDGAENENDDKHSVSRAGKRALRLSTSSDVHQVQQQVSPAFEGNDLEQR